MVSHKRRQHPAGPLEIAAAVHGDVIVNQGKIAGLPWDIEGDFVGDGAGSSHVSRINWRAVAEGDRPGRIVADVFSAVEGGD